MLAFMYNRPFPARFIPQQAKKMIGDRKNMLKDNQLLHFLTILRKVKS
jgi:hypothetical protein